MLVRLTGHHFTFVDDLQVKKLVSCLSTCIFPDKTTYPIDETMVCDVIQLRIANRKSDRDCRRSTPALLTPRTKDMRTQSE
jgi:hypothetical protein